MDIIIIITLSIIILVIVFFSRNIIYDNFANYTDVLNTHNLFILNKSNNEASEYGIDTFLNKHTTLKNGVTTLKTDITNATTLTAAQESELAAMETLIGQLFPSGETELNLLASDNVTIAKLIAANLMMLTGDPVYFRVVSKGITYYPGSAGLATMSSSTSLTANQHFKLLVNV